MGSPLHLVSVQRRLPHMTLGSANLGMKWSLLSAHCKSGHLIWLLDSDIYDSMSACEHKTWSGAISATAKLPMVTVGFPVSQDDDGGHRWTFESLLHTQDKIGWPLCLAQHPMWAFFHFSIWPLSSALVNNKGSLKSAHRDKPTVYEATPAINAIKIIDRAKHLSAAKWRGVRHFNAPEPFCSVKSMLIKWLSIYRTPSTAYREWTCTSLAHWTCFVTKLQRCSNATRYCTCRNISHMASSLAPCDREQNDELIRLSWSWNTTLTGLTLRKSVGSMSARYPHWHETGTRQVDTDVFKLCGFFSSLWPLTAFSAAIVYVCVCSFSASFCARFLLLCVFYNMYCGRRTTGGRKRHAISQVNLWTFWMCRRLLILIKNSNDKKKNDDNSLAKRIYNQSLHGQTSAQGPNAAHEISLILSKSHFNKGF